MIPQLDDRELIVGVTPGSRPDGQLVVGVCRGGGFGVLDVGADLDTALAEIALIERRYGGAFGIRVPSGAALDPATLSSQVTMVVLAGREDVARYQSSGRRAVVEVTSLDEAQMAVARGADGLVAKGSEADGGIGAYAEFVLLQRLGRHVEVPIWLQGGIGLHTAAAAITGGARGVVLDAQLARARDCTLPGPVRAATAAMDASGLADRYTTAGGIVQAVRAAMSTHLSAARDSLPLSPGAGLAAAHGLRYPIGQSPTTRVGDRAAFASVVAEAGGLPFLALSLMRGEEITDLLDATRQQVGGHPFGVGILGSVPPELHEEQLAAVREARPPVALVAGGPASQASPLDAVGIATFLHVPSPGLLDRFLKDGARRFVFDGRGCGGHVGPRSSFTLWEQQVDRLLAEDDLSAVEVFFAGGIHDARSAAMVATLAAPLVERGAGIGVLMGTAYMETAEADPTGAGPTTVARLHAEVSEGSSRLLAALERNADEWPSELFVIRGDAEALGAELDHLGSLLDANDAAGRPWPLRDLARTTAERRAKDPVGCAIVADDHDDLRSKLDQIRAGDTPRDTFVAAGAWGDAGGDEPSALAFLFPGGEDGIRRFQLALAELAASGAPVDVSPLFAGRTAVVDAPTSVRPAQLTNGAAVPSANSEGNGHASDFQSTVSEYLRGLKEIVAAERDLVLAVAGAPMVGGAVQAANAAPPTVTHARGTNLEAASVPAPERLTGAARSGARAPELLRFVPQLVTLGEPASERSLADVSVGVVDRGSNVAGPLCEFLRATEAVPVLLDPDDVALAGLGAVVDLSALWVRADDDVTAAVTRQFDRLRTAALAGVAEIVVVTGLGGSFGLAGTRHDTPLAVGAATVGMLRTMRLEFPDLRLRLVDLPAAGDPHRRARHLVEELLCTSGPDEVGYAAGRRQTVDVVAKGLGEDRDGLTNGEHLNAFHLGAHSVVVVTGGARGIAARCALELARRFGCAFEIVGRSPLPVGDEPADLAAATDERAICELLAERGERTRPGEIEAEARRILTAREIRENLAAIANHARSVEYHSADVRDVAGFAEIVDEIRQRHGRLDGVLHAAGIRDDMRVADKTVESFADVLDTKVQPAELLADAVDYGGFAVFFGSVSGVFGNAGQVDHSAATSALDTLAHARSGAADPRRRERRLLTVDWAPWSGGGPVTPELARQYEKQGVGLVDPDAGAAALVEELRFGAPDPQVVLMGAPPEAVHA